MKQKHLENYIILWTTACSEICEFNTLFLFYLNYLKNIEWAQNKFKTMSYLLGGWFDTSWDEYDENPQNNGRLSPSFIPVHSRCLKANSLAWTSANCLAVFREFFASTCVMVLHRKHIILNLHYIEQSLLLLWKSSIPIPRSWSHSFSWK